LRALIQRVSGASVTVANVERGRIERGLLILLGVKSGDTEADARWLAEKCVHLRIFENEAGKFHYSLLDIKGEALVVSQFTLYGDCRRGRRPGFSEAARPEQANPLYQYFVQQVENLGIPTATGVFAAHMAVSLVNDGPVTLMIDTEER